MWPAAACFLIVTATTADAAKDLYRAGSEAYRHGRYDVAIDAFEEVLKVEPRPQVIFSAAQAHRLQYFVRDELPHLERAVELYREYLDKVPSGGRREHAAQHLSTLTPILEQRRLETDENRFQERAAARLIVSSQVKDATARVDGGPPTPIPAAFEVAPGPHTVVVEAREHQPQARKTVAIKGSAVALNVDLEPAPAQLVISAPSGAQVHVDGRAAGLLPMDKPTPIKPGRHVVSVTARGHNPFTQTIEPRPGEAVALDANLSLTGQRVASYAAYGVGGALLIGSIAAAVASLPKESEASDLERRLDDVGLTVEEANRYAELRGSRDDLVAVAVGLGVGAAAFGIVATAMMIFDDPGPIQGPSPSPEAPGGPLTFERGFAW